LQNIRGAEICKPTKYVDPQGGMTVEALRDRQGKQANTAMEQEKMLRMESCRKNDDHRYYELPSCRTTRVRVTEQAVEWAQYTQSANIASGHNKLTFGAVRQLWN
jgi:hypothetical protein